MSTTKTSDEVLREMNDRARAAGRYLGKAFWEIPSQAESILEVPSTGEAQQRLAALRARRRQRRQNAGEQPVVLAPRQPVATENSGITQ
jgi:hypothetical protein